MCSRWTNHLLETVGIAGTLDECHRVRAPHVPTEHLEVNGLADSTRIQVDPELAWVLNRFAVEPKHDVTHPETGHIGRPVWVDVGEYDTPTLRKAQPLGQFWRDRLSIDAHLTATHRPNRRICSYTVRTMLLGTAKPIPSLPPDWERMKVLIPTTRPSTSTSGPPLLAGLIDASVWTYTTGSSGRIYRAAALTTARLTEFASPNGLPNAMTNSPGLSVSESANSKATSSRSTCSLSTARSVS